MLLPCRVTILGVEHIVTRKTRVFVISGPSLFGNGIEELLGGEPGLEIVGREADPRQAVRRIRECHPDVIVIGDGEGATGLEAELLRLVREGFQMRIVEVHLVTNTVCIFCGEQQSILEAGDLVHTMQHICSGLSRRAEAPLAEPMGPPIT